MRATGLRLFAGALIGAALFAGAGCAREHASVTRPLPGSEAARAADPASSWSPILHSRDGGNQIYPLALGNRWLHEQHDALIFFPDAGSPYTVYERTRTVQRRIVCVQPLGDRTYFVERQSVFPGDSLPFWILMRQDPQGLYEADRDVSTAPPCDDAIRASMKSADPLAVTGAAFERALARIGSVAEQTALRAAWQRQRDKISALAAIAPGGALPGMLRRTRPGPPEGELLRLSYPLRPGVGWVVRDDPRFASFVEGIQTLSMPAGSFQGYRIRITSTLFGPSDRVLEWYGPDGFLRFAYHLESEATDLNGVSLGRLVDDYDEVLTDISLVGHTPGSPSIATR